MSGFNGLFIPGPTNMPFGVRQAMDIPLDFIRTQTRSRALGIASARGLLFIVLHHDKVYFPLVDPAISSASAINSRRSVERGAVSARVFP